MHKVIQLIKKNLYKKNVPFYENTYSLDVLDEKPNHTLISKSQNFQGELDEKPNHTKFSKF